MNRRRLNQMLEVLLFPICDPGQGEKDVLLLCYEPYAGFRYFRSDAEEL